MHRRSVGSRSDPSGKWLRLPNDNTGIRYQDKSGTVSGIVIEFGDIGQSQRLSGIRNAPYVTAPHVGIRNEMATLCCSIPYARDGLFRSLQPDK
jgi:hypothetical protein